MNKQRKFLDTVRQDIINVVMFIIWSQINTNSRIIMLLSHEYLS